MNVKNSVPTIVCFKNEASSIRCLSERSIKIKEERYRYAVIKRAGSSVLVRSEPGAELIDFQNLGITEGCIDQSAGNEKDVTRAGSVFSLKIRSVGSYPGKESIETKIFIIKSEASSLQKNVNFSQNPNRNSFRSLNITTSALYEIFCTLSRITRSLKIL